MAIRYIIVILQGDRVKNLTILNIFSLKSIKNIVELIKSILAKEPVNFFSISIPENYKTVKLGITPHINGRRQNCEHEDQGLLDGLHCTKRNHTDFYDRCCTYSEMEET